MRYLHAEGPQWILERQKLLQPSFFASIPKIEGTNGLYYFKVLETPLRTIIISALDSERPETLIGIQFRILDEWLVKYGLWIVLGISFLINILRVTLVSQTQTEFLYELLVTCQIYALLPILPIIFPVFTVIIRR